ncbi:MAG: terminase large subunit, partial [Acidobacteria bacterium]|nr:terminase large subunit [Acidobacteriota bacterium]
TGSRLVALSADAPGAEGQNLSGLIVDELHAHKTRALFDVLLHAGAARRQPLSITITTAGTYDPASIGWEMHEHARQVLDGTIADDTAFFAFIATADPAADWTDPATWRAANPSIGVTVTEEELTEQCRAARHSPALENVFRRYRLNQWTAQTSRWLNLETWDACDVHPIVEADYHGVRPVGGVDLASTADMTAACWLLPCAHGDAGALDVIVRCWLPEAALAASKNAGLYEQWRRAGWLTVTPGNVVDHGFIVKAILEDAARFGCDSLGLDRMWQGMSAALALADAGLAVFPVGLGFLSMAPLVAEAERLILSGKLHHGGHPILRWNLDSVEMVSDPAGNLKPNRGNRDRKIDCLVALLLGLDRHLRRTVAPEKPAITIDSLNIYRMGGRR